jgi:hypothetical protein
MYYSSLDAPPTTSSDSFSFVSRFFSLSYMQTRRQRTVLSLADWTILSLFINLHVHTPQLMRYDLSISFAFRQNDNKFSTFFSFFILICSHGHKLALSNDDDDVYFCGYSCW